MIKIKLLKESKRLFEASEKDVINMIRLSNQPRHREFFDPESGMLIPERERELHQEVQKYSQKLQQVPKKYTPWILKMSQGDPEPLDEIIDMIKAYDANKNLFQRVKLGQLTPGRIRQALEDAAMEQDPTEPDWEPETLPENVDKIYESETWLGVYPKTEQATIEAARKFSKGVQWCTTATESENYFEFYTGLKKRTYLYYFFKKGGNTRKNVRDAVSIGWKDSQISYGTNTTTDVEGTDLYAQDLAVIFEDEWEPIYNSMKEDLKTPQREFPAYQMIQEAPFKTLINMPFKEFSDVIKKFDYFSLKAFLKSESILKDRQRLVFTFREYALKADPIYLKDFKFTKLPPNLKVRGDLDLQYSQITELLPGLEVGGSLELSFSKITELPPNLKVRGDLELSDSQITKLPSGLEVGGSLNLFSSKITELPPGLEVGGSLELSDSQITKLPPDLKVGGNLNLSSSKITELPPSLEVGGNLNLQYSQIIKLSPNLKIGGNLILSRSQITKLPPDIKVGGDIKLSDSQMTELPPGLEVGGGLDLRFSQITELPPDIKVGGNLDLSHSQITELPPGLEVGRNLNLSSSKITELPPGIKVGGNLNLSSSKITELPPSLEVGGNLNLQYSQIIKLSPNLKIGGILGLSYSQITELPPGLEVGRNLNLSSSQITELPPDLKVGGNLDLSHSQITELPPDIKVGGNLDLSHSQITKLPPDLKVGGKIIGYSGIKEAKRKIKIKLLKESRKLLLKETREYSLLVERFGEEYANKILEGLSDYLPGSNANRMRKILGKIANAKSEEDLDRIFAALPDDGVEFLLTPPKSDISIPKEIVPEPETEPELSSAEIALQNLKNKMKMSEPDTPEENPNQTEPEAEEIEGWDDTENEQLPDEEYQDNNKEPEKSEEGEPDEEEPITHPLHQKFKNKYIPLPDNPNFADELREYHKWISSQMKKKKKVFISPKKQNKEPEPSPSVLDMIKNRARLYKATSDKNRANASGKRK